MIPHRIVVVVLMGVLAQFVAWGGGGTDIAAQTEGCPDECASAIRQLAVAGCRYTHTTGPSPDHGGGC
jgi:hypothetical protein